MLSLRSSRFARSLAESPARRLLAWSPLLEDLSRMSPEEADAVGALPPMANPLVVSAFFPLRRETHELPPAGRR